jgi:hypothetical protein
VSPPCEAPPGLVRPVVSVFGQVLLQVPQRGLLLALFAAFNTP